MDVAYLKSVMREAGFLTNPSPGLEWREFEEQAWRQVCAKLGLRFTPYPSRENQDLYWLDVIDKKQLVLKAPEQAPPPVFDIRDLLPAPTKFAPDTPAAVIRKHATLLDPELPKEEVAKYPHAKKLPRKFITKSSLRDPLEGTTPNPVLRRRPAVQRANTDKAARLNKVLQDEPKIRDADKPIRVR